MTSESEKLTRQIDSMRRRFDSLVEMAGVDSPAGGVGGGGEMDKLTLKIEEVNDQVRPHEANLLNEVIQ